MSYMQSEQLGDIGKFSLKKIGKKVGGALKKVAKVAVPVVMGAGGAVLGVKAGKGIVKAVSKKKKKKQAIASGSSGGAVEVQAAAAQTGMTPEQVIAAIQQGQAAAQQIPAAVASGFNQDVNAIPADMQPIAAGVGPADLSPGKLALIAAAGLGLFLVMRPKGGSRRRGNI